MSLEKRFKTVEDVELLEAWMGAPDAAKPELPERLANYLKRLQLAYRWYQEHGSGKVVRNMLIAHFRTSEQNYSLKTAIRDLDDAMRLFRTSSKYSTRFTAEMMLDNLLERYLSEARAGRGKECAALAKEIREYLKLIDKYIEEDAARISDPIPIIGTFELKEAGLVRTEGLEERIAWFKQDFERRKRAGFRPTTDGAADADFTEET